MTCENSSRFRLLCSPFPHSHCIFQLQEIEEKRFFKVRRAPSCRGSFFLPRVREWPTAPPSSVLSFSPSPLSLLTHAFPERLLASSPPHLRFQPPQWKLKPTSCPTRASCSRAASCTSPSSSSKGLPSRSRAPLPPSPSVRSLSLLSDPRPLHLRPPPPCPRPAVRTAIHEAWRPDSRLSALGDGLGFHRATFVLRANQQRGGPGECDAREDESWGSLDSPVRPRTDAV